MNWTDTEDKILIENRPNMSAAKLADLIGCTRNAVIGRSHRLGLEKLTSSPVTVLGRPRSVNGERKVRKPPPFHVVETALPVTPLNIPFIELAPHHCREIVGYGDFNLSLSCGHPVIEGKSWCIWHASMNYEKPRARQVQSMAA